MLLEIGYHLRIMDLRRIESGLAWFTLGALVLYFPIETYVSLPHGLWHPFYIVDLIAMVLMFWGATRSLKARPEPSPGVLCAAYAWAAANGWRATFARWFEMFDGGRLDYGSAEFLFVSIATAVGLVCLALSLFLVVRSSTARS